MGRKSFQAGRISQGELKRTQSSNQEWRAAKQRAKAFKTVNIAPTPEALRVMFVRMGVGECPHCGDYGPHRKVARAQPPGETRFCRTCKRKFTVAEVPYLKGVTP